MKLQSYAEDRWHEASGGFAEARSAIDGRLVAEISSEGLEMGALVRHAKTHGGPALRRLTFTQRAELLKALAQHLTAHKEALYKLSYDTGATLNDSRVDIDGGIGVLAVYASKGRRELPNERFLIDGEAESLSKGGKFLAQHLYVPREGVAVEINAYNFPVWGMLEKLAPSILAGLPVIAKPATSTSFLAEAAARLIADSGILPKGAFQFVCGSIGDLFDHLDGQDSVAFTGSLATSIRLQAHPALLNKAVRFTAERDSLNCSILGPDVTPEAPEFDLFIKEVAREMTVKAGQKCTAIRRILVPQNRVEAVGAALSARLAKVQVGDPRKETTRMGALCSLEQREDVRRNIERLRREARIVFGDPERVAVDGADDVKGAFLSPILMLAEDSAKAELVHSVEAFGPVSTLLAYRDVSDVIDLARKGEGSLAGSLVTYDSEVARQIVFGAAASHGRLLVLDRDCAAESTGHGSPMPQTVHGGPGRAGGGEELGGLRAVRHHMQRVAVQGSPALLSKLTGAWLKGAPEVTKDEHPFRYAYGALEIGQTFRSAERTISIEDIEHFAEFTGDNFYAHMDEEAVKGHPFFPGRVAHGYLLLAFAAGLFVEPARGPVLANFGLDNLRFVKPVQPGESVKVRLTVKHKAPRNKEYGEVRWDVEITTGTGETAATYELLTMNAH